VSAEFLFVGQEVFHQPLQAERDPSSASHIRAGAPEVDSLIAVTVFLVCYPVNNLIKFQ
jgi:hypothetical protein